MSEVKRYTVFVNKAGYGVVDDLNGPLVMFDDYAELKEQRDALTAENAALKGPELQEFLRLVECMNSDHCDGNYGHSYEWIRHIVAQQNEYEEKFGDTPWGVVKGSKYLTTDAYLNSVRAEAVTSFAHHQRVIADSETDPTIQRGHRITACRAEDFAAQLRAGEPS